jgi:hypothetical protein
MRHSVGMYLEGWMYHSTVERIDHGVNFEIEYSNPSPCLSLFLKCFIVLCTVL